jgi:two-component system sensor histidine kinase/response regulator
MPDVPAAAAQAWSDMIDMMDDAIDVPALMVRLEGDRDLLKELVGLYLEDEQGLIDQIAAAIRDLQPDALRRAAHTLKGSVANFCAASAQATAAALEAAGQDGRLDSAPDLFGRLVAELERVRTGLRALEEGQDRC